MKPDPTKLLEIVGIKIPLIGFYDVPDPKPFEPFVRPERCIFSAYENWLKDEIICISKDDPNYRATCQGGGYWIGNVWPQWVVKNSTSELNPHQNFAKGLNQREGFKSSDELMYKWLENLKPYIIKNGCVVIGPLKDEQYEYLTVTFYVDPDQLSLLIIGAEYNNASIKENPVITAFGSGCRQLAALFDDLLYTDIPKAVIGATDIAMREYLPPDLLAFTVNKPMFKQLCALDENSFLYKQFWKRLRKARGKVLNESRAIDGK